MAAIRDVEVGAIEAGRRALVELQLAHQTTTRVARKQAVKELFGTLLASWEAGVPFDAMAKTLTSSGIQITPETLRGYFFEMKTAGQLRAENAEHEREMAKMRKANESEQRAKDLQHARELGQARAELISSAREANVEAAHQLATQAVDVMRRGPIGVTSAAAERKQPARELATSHGFIQPGEPWTACDHVIITSKDTTNFSSAVAGPAISAQAAAEVTAPPEVGHVTLQSEICMADAPVRGQSAPLSACVDSSQAAKARTLDEIARDSQGQRETSYTENLVLKERNTVWYDSGKPFDGFLSPRTLHTLRNVGKVIAPTEGRTSKDFVTMSNEL